MKEIAKKPYIRYASLAHEIDRHNKITSTPGHQWLPFKGQYFFPSLTTCWSKLMLPLMDYQRWCCLDYCWYLPTCRTLKSPLKRYLSSITLPICHCQAVCHRNWGSWGSTGMVFPVNTTVWPTTFAVILCWRTIHSLSWNTCLSMFAFISRINSIQTSMTLQETLQACSSSL